MADLLQRGDGIVRQADAVLRGAGGWDVVLRLTAPAVSGDDAEQLGLASPAFQDVVVGPAVFRQAESPKTLLLSASAVLAVVGSLAFDSAEVLFEAAVGVVIDEVLYWITDSVASQAMGEPYCYCLTLERPIR